MIIKAVKNGNSVGLELLGTKGYNSVNTVLQCICDDCGQQFSITAKSLNRSNVSSLRHQYCKVCSSKRTNIIKYGVDNHAKLDSERVRIGNLKRIPFSVVKKDIDSEPGYKVVCTEQEYVNSNGKIIVECSNCEKPHRFSTTINKWRRGYRCRKFSMKQVGIKNRVSFDFIKNSIESEGYKVLTKEEEYKNNSQKLKTVCPNGHIYYVSWGTWNTGKHRCRLCYNKKVSERQKLSYEFVKKAFESRGYTLLSKEYKGANDYLYYICPNGHKGRMQWLNFQQGHGCNSCPKVTSNTSKAEQELADFLKPHFPDLVRNDRLLISPFELDIVIPSKRTAIEYCGLYWHSELNGKNRSYHLQKLTKCESIGYNLITIFEDEWVQKRNIAESRLKNILGIDDAETLYARNCVIKEIDARTKNEFLDRNHLQGRDNSSVKLGAFYKDKLVSVMTFSKGNISKGAKAESGVWELNRFCSDYDYHIVGIASKLLKYFKNNYDYTKIYSYSDRRWSTGKLYETLGFMKSHDSEPNYWYLVGDTRVHRFGFRKGVLKKKLELFDSKLSEWQNMINNGFNRIWDCGNTKWETFSAF